jgi:hypothetical protein
MAPLAVPIPGVASTPPSSRSGTPTARHSLKQYVGTVLPFTRSSGSGRLTPGPSIGSEDIAREVSTSYTKEEVSRHSSGPSQRGDGSFLPDSAGSWVSIKRATPRSASTFAAMAPFSRQQGFSAPSPELQEAPRPSAPQGLGAPQGLLSRALSSECLAPRPHLPLESSPSRVCASRHGRCVAATLSGQNYMRAPTKPIFLSCRKRLFES